MFSGLSSTTTAKFPSSSSSSSIRRYTYSSPSSPAKKPPQSGRRPVSSLSNPSPINRHRQHPSKRIDKTTQPFLLTPGEHQKPRVLHDKPTTTTTIRTLQNRRRHDQRPSTTTTTKATDGEYQVTSSTTNLSPESPSTAAEVTAGDDLKRKVNNHNNNKKKKQSTTLQFRDSSTTIIVEDHQQAAFEKKKKTKTTAANTNKNYCESETSSITNNNSLSSSSSTSSSSTENFPRLNIYDEETTKLQLRGNSSSFFGKLLRRKQSMEKEVEAEIEKQKLHYRPEGVDALVRRTQFTRKEVQLLYRSFKENCPNGIVSLEKFQTIFAQFFYYGDPSGYAELVFNTFDEDGNGEISFEEFVTGLSRLWRGTRTQKLEWVFELYDNHQQGFITKEDLLRVTKAVYDMIGPHAYPPVTSEEIMLHVQEVFRKLDKDDDGKVTLDEFLELCEADSTVCQCLDLFKTAGYGFCS